MDIYMRIDKILEEKRMSRRQLAIAAGISESTLSTAFIRKSKLSTENLQKIASALGVTLLYLTAYDPIMEIREDTHKAEFDENTIERLKQRNDQIGIMNWLMSKNQFWAMIIKMDSMQTEYCMGQNIEEWKYAEYQCHQLLQAILSDWHEKALQTIAMHQSEDSPKE